PSGNTPTDGLFSATNTVPGIAVGYYNVHVRDNGGVADYCEAVFPLNIVKDPALDMDVNTDHNLCSGDAQGQIVVIVTGGEAPYTYSINGGTNQTSNTFMNLAAGSYVVRVTDANNCFIEETHTITEPYTLSASAAVTALVECNPTDGAEVRITNAIGGTAPYQYSFSGGTSYGSNPIGFLLPGTHTVYIQDVNGCTFPMVVTIEPEPTPPTVTPDIAFDCEGEGIITLSPNSTDFDYTYLLDGTPNTPVDSNTFNNVLVGPHTITVNYTSNSAPAASILLDENFGFGPTTSIIEVDPNFCYEPLDGTVTPCNTGGVGQLANGEYTVTQSIAGSWDAGWRSPKDQTTGRSDGRFLAIDLGTAAGEYGIIYAKRGIEVIPNRELTISMNLFNLVYEGYSGSQLDPNVRIELVDGSGNVISDFSTGNISRNQNENDWRHYSTTLDPANNTNIDIVIRTHIDDTHGNDLAIDDIQAFQIPEVCPGSFTVDVNVEDGHAFDAGLTGHTNISCFGGNDGSISFEVENFDPTDGYTYSLNGVAVPGIQTNGTVDLSGLTAGSYTIRVVDQRDGSCFVEFTQILTEPTAVEVSASINELTCTNGGGTLTATASGGTPTYEYQLEDDSANILVGYQTDHVFTGLTAGVYIIRAKDSNGCEDVSEALTISVPETIEFDLLPTACYGGNNDGSIQVDITNGNEGYKFRLNGGGWITPIPVESNTHIFNGLAAGTYTIDVMDGYGCIEQDTVTIVDALVASVEVVDISTCADGSITVTASGGSPTLEYAFVVNGIDPDGTFTGSNVFTVVLGNEGTYDVYVRDNSANNPYCEFMETVVVNPPTPLTMDVTPTDPDCHDGTGSILVEITSGIAPYTIQIVDLDNGGTSNQTATNVLTTTRTYYNLQPGNYDIIVT